MAIGRAYLQAFVEPVKPVVCNMLDCGDSSDADATADPDADGTSDDGRRDSARRPAALDQRATAAAPNHHVLVEWKYSTATVPPRYRVRCANVAFVTLMWFGPTACVPNADSILRLVCFGPFIPSLPAQRPRAHSVPLRAAARGLSIALSGFPLRRPNTPIDRSIDRSIDHAVSAISCRRGYHRRMRYRARDLPAATHCLDDELSRPSPRERFAARGAAAADGRGAVGDAGVRAEAAS